jgi:gluconolactonase
MRGMLLGLGFVAACGGGGGEIVDGRAAGDATSNVDASPDPLIGIGAVELVQGGYQFTEGPQWRDATGDLVFSDIPGNTIYRHVPGSAPTILRMPSDNANGLAIDLAGDLLAAEHGSRGITRTTSGGTTIVVDRYLGDRLNSPNDVITDDVLGVTYFTDPPYGISTGERELAFNGVFRIDPTGGLHADYQGAVAERPNGIVIDRLHQRVLVADTADGNVYAFPIGSDGALGARSVFVATAGNPDGMAIDAAYNLFVTTADGVEVFSPGGTRWGLIEIPQQPSNCAFGGADHRTLYVTARTAVYRVTLALPGSPRD